MKPRTLRHATNGRRKVVFGVIALSMAGSLVIRELGVSSVSSAMLLPDSSQDVVVARAMTASTTEVDVTAIISRDPFRVDRTEFVATEAIAAATELTQLSDSVRLLGTIMDSAQGNAAVLTIGEDGLPLTLREGAKIGDRTLRLVHPGVMVLVDRRGQEAVIRVPSPGQQ